MATDTNSIPSGRLQQPWSRVALELYSIGFSFARGENRNAPASRAERRGGLPRGGIVADEDLGCVA